MPGFDGTGPQGFGPMTGRGLGPCGCGMRRGFGRGFRRRFPVVTEKEEKQILEYELKDIEAEKREVEKRLKELK